LFNTIEDGVLVVDETGRILYFNQAVTRLLGLQHGTAEGQLVSQFLPELDWEKLAAFDRSGGVGVTRHEIEVAFPRPRVLSLYAAPLDGAAAGSTGLALIVHDATEARQRTHEAIETERLQALTLLAASVAHEIGNPINALSIHFQLMERELGKLRTATARPTTRGKPSAPPTADSLARLGEYLRVCQGEIGRLDYIVTQFLQAIRPSAPQFRPACLNDVARDTLALLRPELENRGIEVREHYARQLPDARIDPLQIKQALVNLIKNAMQAMTRGGVLTVQTDRTADEVSVSVIDTGGGIPQEQINRIFEPFYTTKKKGTGLGLMIVQRIVRAHGGKIDLESRVGQGTLFRIRLPLPDRAPRLLEARHGGG
jgi:PAS domain S-box-containing protein